MKTDPLEKLVLENRDAFDLGEPSPELWDRIEKPKKARVIDVNWKKVAWRAAAVAIIFTASYFFHDFVNRDVTMQVANVEDEGDASELLEQFKEAEIFYTSQINTRKEEVVQLSRDDPSVMEIVDMELVALDQIYKELIKDLNDNADNEQVIEALIQNYRLKLEILEEMQYLLEESQNSEKNSNHEYRSL
jgi:hypothetical protein